MRRLVLWGALVTVAVAVLPGCRAREAAPFSGASAPPASTTTTEPPLPIYLGAEASVPSVAVYAAPGASGPVRTMSNPTFEGVPLAFLVTRLEGDWAEVRLNVRPNGSTGWIRTADVALHDLPYRIVVDRGAHTLTLFEGRNPLVQATVAVGTGGTPTPTGNFYIDAIVDLTKHPNTVWGAYQLSVSGFSDVLHRFGGGSGQIAIHGTNAPGLVGRDVSHGCVRMRNEDITQVAQHISLGTPVDIVD